MIKFSAKEVMHHLSDRNGVLRKVTTEEREKLQKVQVQILKDVQDTCKKIGIECALCGGSCLGAIRHQGFIPWDDDLDICITRKEWEIFKHHFEETLSEKYVLESPNYGDKDSKYPWSKIYLKGSEMQEILDINAPYCKGIYIDVFVLENVPDNRFLQYFEAIITAGIKYVASSMLFYKYSSKEMKSYFSVTTKGLLYYRLRQTLGFLFSFISHKKLLEIYDKFASRHKENTKMLTIPTGTHLYLGEMLPRGMWIPYSKAKFCGMDVNIPSQPDKYLSMMYGSNYMEIPQEKDRVSHFIYSLKFPNEA